MNQTRTLQLNVQSIVEGIGKFPSVALAVGIYRNYLSISRDHWREIFHLHCLFLRKERRDGATANEIHLEMIMIIIITELGSIVFIYLFSRLL